MPITPRSRRIRPTRIEDSDVEMDEAPKNNEVYGEEGLTIDVEAVPEEDVDGEGESEDNDLEDEDDAEGDEEDQEDTPSDAELEGNPDRPSLSHQTPSSSRLKIKFKMPSQPPSSRFDTPNVESEDEDMSDDDSEPVSRPTTTRPMTTRQAVLASVLDSSHVSLNESRSKKPQLNETELALRREETARKRKNLTEKKLEDEKLETINRLLKKQSRPRNKRNTAQSRDQDDSAPIGSVNRLGAGSRRGGSKKAAAGSQEGDEDADDDEAMEAEENDGEEQAESELQRAIPTMYRWVSSCQQKATGHQGSGETQMSITFSVPVSAMPSANFAVAGSDGSGACGSGNSDTRISQRSARPTMCSVPGCDKPFRYRLVKDWTRGACGIVCLKVLEAAV